MKAVYYFDEQNGYCPVKKYLEQYRTKSNDKLKIVQEKEKLYKSIEAKIVFVVENYGRPIPPISKSLREYSYLEIRARKNKSILIRIFYFRYDEKIVLLNAIEKPDHDNKKNDQGRMNRCLEITKIYQEEFIINPKLYEEYI